ncbi:MAG: type II secretion system F family protein [Lachnospiraceae bacterium]|nr:type II secretion system F family protein [Lachnospiraceae bacterium]
MGLFNKNKKEEYVPKTGILGNADDYSVYEMKPVEKILYFVLAAVVGAVVGNIFYENMILSGIAALICGFVFVPVRKKQIIAKRQQKLLLQFKDMLDSLSTSIGAGSNVHDAFASAAHDMEMQYTADSDIYRELKIILAGMANNINIEELLLDFGDRSQQPDIISFANVFDTCYRKGGNIRDVLKNTYRILCDKIDISLEIKTMVSSKTSEQNIMLVMPVIFVYLLKQMGSDVINLTSSTGRTSTTIAVLMFAAAYWLSKKILNIKI